MTNPPKPIASLGFRDAAGNAATCTALLTEGGSVTIRNDKDGTILRRHPATHIRRYGSPLAYLIAFYDYIPITPLNGSRKP